MDNRQNEINPWDEILKTLFRKVGVDVDRLSRELLADRLQAVSEKLETNPELAAALDRELAAHPEVQEKMDQELAAFLINLKESPDELDRLIENPRHESDDE